MKKVIEEPDAISLQRSKLSNAAFIKWIRSRFSTHNPKTLRYLYFP